MGVVYRARLEGEGGFVRDFALKKLHEHLAEDQDVIQMFLDEARLAAMIRHPNVVATVDVGRDGESFFVVMDLIEGVSGSELRERGPLPTGVAARILLDVLDGLDAAHGAIDGEGRQLEIVHRDVSPANVLVGRDGIAKLTDFGIAKARERLRTTVGFEVKGKLAYMPPEQFEGADVDRRADLFAAGVVLWELLTGQTMLHGNRPRLRELGECEGDPPAWFPTPAGPRVDAVIRRAMALAVEARYPDARAMAAALRDAVGEAVASPTTVGAIVGEAMVLRPEVPPSSRRIESTDAAPSAAAWALPSAGLPNVGGLDGSFPSQTSRVSAAPAWSARDGEDTAGVPADAAWSVGPRSERGFTSAPAGNRFAGPTGTAHPDADETTRDRPDETAPAAPASARGVAPAAFDNEPLDPRARARRTNRIAVLAGVGVLVSGAILGGLVWQRRIHATPAAVASSAATAATAGALIPLALGSPSTASVDPSPATGPIVPTPLALASSTDRAPSAVSPSSRPNGSPPRKSRPASPKGGSAREPVDQFGGRH